MVSNRFFCSHFTKIKCFAFWKRLQINPINSLRAQTHSYKDLNNEETWQCRHTKSKSVCLNSSAAVMNEAIKVVILKRFEWKRKTWPYIRHTVICIRLFPLIHLHFVKLFDQNENKILRKVVKTFKKNMCDHVIMCAYNLLPFTFM